MAINTSKKCNLCSRDGKLNCNWHIDLWFCENHLPLHMMEQHQEILMKTIELNSTYVIHLAKQRLLFLPAFTAIFSSIFYLIIQNMIKINQSIALVLLIVFSIAGLLFSLKTEAVINSYNNKNKELAKQLKITEFLGLWVVHSVWWVIRMRHIFPSFY